MQKKKYFFELIFVTLVLVSGLISFSEVNAGGCCLPSYEYFDKGTDCTTDFLSGTNDCAKESGYAEKKICCTIIKLPAVITGCKEVNFNPQETLAKKYEACQEGNTKISIGSIFDGTCKQSSGAKLACEILAPKEKKWCCDDAKAKKCVDILEGGECDPAATQYTYDCKNVTSCKAYNDKPNPPTGPTNNTSIAFPNPITSNSIDEVLTSLLSALSGLVVTLAIVFIVLGGILYMMSAGDPGMIKRAKDCWLYSVIGLAIVIAAPTFLKQIQIILGGKLTGGGIENAYTISQIATNVLNFLLSLVGIIAIISLVIAGGMYMTAYGDDTRLKKAKDIGTWAIVGIVVALVSLIAVQQISKLITG